MRKFGSLQLSLALGEVVRVCNTKFFGGRRCIDTAGG